MYSVNIILKQGINKCQFFTETLDKNNLLVLVVLGVLFRWNMGVIFHNASQFFVSLCLLSPYSVLKIFQTQILRIHTHIFLLLLKWCVKVVIYHPFPTQTPNFHFNFTITIYMYIFLHLLYYRTLSFYTYEIVEITNMNKIFT